MDLLGVRISWRCSFREAPPIFMSSTFRNPLDSQGQDPTQIPSCFRQRLGEVTIFIYAQNILHNEVLLSKGPTLPEPYPLGVGGRGRAINQLQFPRASCLT